MRLLPTNSYHVKKTRSVNKVKYPTLLLNKFHILIHPAIFFYIFLTGIDHDHHFFFVKQTTKSNSYDECYNSRRCRFKYSPYTVI